MTGGPAHDGSAVGVVRELARRFGSGDLEHAFALYAPDIRVQQPATLPHGGWHQGRAGLAEMARLFGTHWTRSIDPVEVFGQAGKAVQLTTQTWTSTATGRAATVDVVELFSVVDGTVAEIRVFQQDTAALLATLPDDGRAPDNGRT